MKPEYMEEVYKEVEENTKRGGDFFDEFQRCVRIFAKGVRSIFGERGMHWDSDTKNWVLTKDPRYGGQPSVLDILKFGQFKTNKNQRVNNSPQIDTGFRKFYAGYKP